MVKLQTVFEYKELDALQYPIIVQCWDKCMGSMKFKRNYNKEFTEQERALIRSYHKIFYDWAMRRGTPQEHVMKYATYTLMQRAVEFFACN